MFHEVNNIDSGVIFKIIILAYNK